MATEEDTDWKTFFKELKEDWTQVRQSGWQAVRHPRREWPRFMLFLIWAAGALGDAVSTQLMMIFGYDEENPVAAAAMATAGREVYILLVTAIFLCFALLAVAVPKSTIGWVIVATTTVACLIKFWVAVGNFVFWYHTWAG